MKSLPSRKTTRLAPHNYRGFQCHFLTLCCYRRQAFLADPQTAKWILTTLAQAATTRGFAIPAFCAMSDHLHFLATGTKPDCDLLSFVKTYKIKTSRRFAKERAATLWQHAYHEHVVRDARSVEQIAWYIWLNPVRKGLVRVPQDYSLCGSFTGLEMPRGWMQAGWSPPWKIKTPHLSPS